MPRHSSCTGLGREELLLPSFERTNGNTTNTVVSKGFWITMMPAVNTSGPRAGAGPSGPQTARCYCDCMWPQPCGVTLKWDRL